MSEATDRPWSPYAAGVGIGALEWFTFGTAEKGLGVTTPFETAAVLLQQKLAPQSSRVNRFLKEREEPPAIDWEFALTAGIALGSWLVTRGRAPDARPVPRLWARRFGPSPLLRYGAAFAGGALMMLGARAAKGCTSGHGITGTLQLAASSWLFSAVMGASAAATARLLFGRK
jgi:uncharacterized membrane protein YedE/YeeE